MKKKRGGRGRGCCLVSHSSKAVCVGCDSTGAKRECHHAPDAWHLFPCVFFFDCFRFPSPLSSPHVQNSIANLPSQRACNLARSTPSPALVRSTLLRWRGQTSKSSTFLKNGPEQVQVCYCAYKNNPSKKLLIFNNFNPKKSKKII